MAEQSMMARLRNANPEPRTATQHQEIRDRIVALPAEWQSAAPGQRRDRHTAALRSWTGRRAGPRPWLAISGIAAIVTAVVLVIALSGSTPPTALAFPVLNSPAVITPVDLQRALVVYGVGPGNAGLQIRKGHPVKTPWGTGYVLTDQGRSVVCVVAPGRNPQQWGASCARTKMAAATGTLWMEYAYDPATGTARLISLLPQDASAAIQTRGGSPRPVKLNDGLLAINVTHPIRLSVSVNGRTVARRLSPKSATPPAAASAGSASTTATATTSASSAP